MYRIIQLSFAFMFLTASVALAQEPLMVESVDQEPVAEDAWHLKTDDALKQAKRQQLPLIISVEVDGCMYCEMMRSDTWTDSKIDSSIRKHFVALRLDKDQQAKVVDTLKLKKFPATLIYAADGKMIAKKEGMMFAGECREWLSKAEDKLDIVEAEALAAKK